MRKTLMETRLEKGARRGVVRLSQLESGEFTVYTKTYGRGERGCHRNLVSFEDFYAACLVYDRLVKIATNSGATAQSKMSIH